MYLPELLVNLYSYHLMIALCYVGMSAFIKSKRINNDRGFINLLHLAMDLTNVTSSHLQYRMIKY